MSNSKSDLAVIVRADSSQLTSDLQRAAASARSFAKQIERAYPKSTAVDNHTAALRANAKAAGEARVRHASAASSLGNFIGKTAAAGAALLAVNAGLNMNAAAFEMISSSVKMAAELEQTTIAFETLMGSASKATDMLGELRTFAANTPFSSKEVVDGARQLLAFGFAGDQIIPVLRLIGEESASVGASLKENLRTFGQVKNSGVLNQENLNEFIDRGHNLMPFIAKEMKIDVSQVRKAISDVEVDYNTTLKAWIALNQSHPGGLERQAKSLKGAFEQLSDAWDMTKIKLGQVIIRETGLYDLTKNAEKFTQTIGKALDSPEFSRGVRFIADLTKGVAQLAYESQRISAVQYPVWLDAIARAFPGIQRTASALHDLAKDAQDFKFDDEKLLNTAYYFAEEFTIAIDKIGRRIETGIIKPVEDGLKKVATLKAWAVAPGAASAADIAKQASESLKSLFPAMPAPNQVTPLSGDKELLAEFGRLKARVVQTELETLKPTVTAKQQVEAAEAAKAFNQFMMQFKLGPGQLTRDLEQMFEKGTVPPRVANPKFPLIPEPIARAPVETDEQREDRARAEEIRKSFAPFREISRQRLIDDRAAKMRAGWSELKDSLSKNAAPGYAVSDRLGLSAALGPLGAAAAGFIPSKGTDYPRLETGPAPRLVELASSLNDQFLPFKALEKRLADLTTLRTLNQENPALGIGQHVFDLARSNAIMDTAQRLGLSSEPRLAGGAEVGSAEDARMLALHRAGGAGPSNVETLLQRIANIEEQILRTAQRSASGTTPPPIQFSGGADF